MIKIVLDTNIIISAALSPNGNPAKIIELIHNKNEVQIYYNADILAEYKDVLSRPRMNIADEIQTRIADAIINYGILIEPVKSSIAMPDESDRIFYDTAKASGAILVTGNSKHYPAEQFIMTPVDLLRHYYTDET